MEPAAEMDPRTTPEVDNFQQHPDVAALGAEAREQLTALASRLSPAETLLAARWLLGRLAAPATAESPLLLNGAPPPEGRAIPTLTLLVGTHSGNSTSVAEQLAVRARERGWQVTVADLADYPRTRLKRESLLGVIVSTHGDGEPPPSAVPFFDFLRGPRAPQLPQTRFAVLALGDRTYTRFCQAGRELDERLSALGAQRLLARVELDTDFREGAAAWSTSLLDALGAPPAPAKATAASISPARTPPARISRTNPWPATVLDRVRLSGRGSTQHFTHLELSLEGSRLSYEPGDSLGYAPQNDPRLVEALLTGLRAAPQTPVRVGSAELPLVEALTSRLDLRALPRSAARAYAQLAGGELKTLASDDATLNAYLRGRD